MYVYDVIECHIGNDGSNNYNTKIDDNLCAIINCNTYYNHSKL